MNDNLAVIFDMDGVLVDSYHAHFASWRVVAEEVGRPLSEADFASQFGRTNPESIAGYWGEGTFDAERIAALDDLKETAFRRIIAADFPAMPGAVELIGALDDAGFSIGLGSSGPPENVDLVLDRLDARPLFGAVVTGTDVTRGKPDPQVFLLAAERLDVPPSRCVVIEDAPAGLRAAEAAEMASVGIASTGRSRQSLAEADLVVDALAQLSPQVLRELILRSTRE
jgi:beta-phosphoglucomutase